MWSKHTNELKTTVCMSNTISSLEDLKHAMQLSDRFAVIIWPSDFESCKVGTEAYAGGSVVLARFFMSEKLLTVTGIPPQLTEGVMTLLVDVLEAK